MPSTPHRTYCFPATPDTMCSHDALSGEMPRLAVEPPDPLDAAILKRPGRFDRVVHQAMK